VGDQPVVGMIAHSAPGIEPGDVHAEDDEAGAQTRLREEARGARPDGQAGPDPDEQDAQGEERRLALDRRGTGPDVAEAGQAARTSSAPTNRCIGAIIP
jgi:hypothetical protein